MRRLLPYLLLALVGCGSGTEQAPPETAAEAPAAFKQERKFLYPATFKEGRPFTPGVMAGQTLYLSGVVGADPMTGERPASIADQTKRAMENVGLILKEAGLTYSDLVSCHVQLTDMENYKAMNEVYGSFYEEGKYPARTTLEMAGLVGGNEIEITCTAYAGEKTVIKAAEGAAPPAMGPYSSAIKAGNTMYLSGQGGRDPVTNEVAPTSEAQTARTLQTIGAILEAGGLGFKNVAFSNVYYHTASDLAGINKAYAEKFADGTAPSRGAFHLSGLPGTINVEITFIAAADDYITRLYPPDTQPGALESPASLTGGTLYLSAATAAGDTVEAQMRALMAEQEARLKRANMTFANVVDAKVYLGDVADFKAMNDVFVQYFAENPPSRTTVGVNFTGGEKLAIAFIAVE
ncbi:MAG: RidA family protein [Acidobacteria bacterium]|nr:RidA family protein [Acidobacteriota bacterium]